MIQVIDAHDDFIIIELSNKRYKLTIEQLAYLVRQAYWRLDQRSGTYLARIISDALIEPPVEAPPDVEARHIRTGQRYTAQALRKQIRAHNPPVGKRELEPVQETTAPPEPEEPAAEREETSTSAIDQAHLLTSIEEAFTVLETETGARPSVEQVRAYLRDHHDLLVDAERIKDAGDIVLSLCNAEEEGDNDDEPESHPNN